MFAVLVFSLFAPNPTATVSSPARYCHLVLQTAHALLCSHRPCGKEFQRAGRLHV